MSAERDDGLSIPGPDPSPGGDVYDWYQRGLDLLKNGSPEAAAQLLVRAASAQPSSPSIQEALARAQFDAGRYAEAANTFRGIVDDDLADHYARFGLGMASMRLGITSKRPSSNSHLRRPCVLIRSTTSPRCVVPAPRCGRVETKERRSAHRRLRQRPARSRWRRLRWSACRDRRAGDDLRAS